MNVITLSDKDVIIKSISKRAKEIIIDCINENNICNIAILNKKVIMEVIASLAGYNDIDWSKVKFVNVEDGYEKASCDSGTHPYDSNAFNHIMKFYQHIEGTTIDLTFIDVDCSYFKDFISLTKENDCHGKYIVHKGVQYQSPIGFNDLLKSKNIIMLFPFKEQAPLVKQLIEGRDNKNSNIYHIKKNKNISVYISQVATSKLQNKKIPKYLVI
ncbi:hypothetical protein O1O06_04285 [Grimontia hollisae]|uniref:hypothetical protein n=1 Tax=Grimontia hollisae TaxID=673 RepID=UPI0023D97A09|nr:hypothetical protein [Grimontia hollisae]MDF2183983.1 hypothetical protein [Grimontia hollisae]